MIKQSSVLFHAVPQLPWHTVTTSIPSNHPKNTMIDCENCGQNACSQVGENDARLLMNFYGEIANADLEADSGYNLTQANLIKLCQVRSLFDFVMSVCRVLGLLRCCVVRQVGMLI